MADFVNGSTNENCDTKDSRVQLVMTFDSNKDGKLSLDNFLDFYRHSCIEKGNLAIVRNNLKNHGFR